MAKVIIYSDVHFGINDSLLPYQITAMEDMLSYALDNNITNRICCGDLFHTPGRLTDNVMYVVRQYFKHAKQNGMMDTILMGNHDVNRMDVVVSSLCILDEIVDHVIIIPKINKFGPNHEFHFVPYTQHKKTLMNSLLCYDGYTTNTETVFFLHQGVLGHPIGSDFVIKDEIFDTSIINSKTTPYIKRVFTGHYHTHADVTDLITIVGSLCQLNWGDKGQKKGFLVLDTESYEYEFIEQNVCPKHIELPFNHAFMSTRVLALDKDRLIGMVDGTGNHIKILHTKPGMEEKIRAGLAPANPASVQFEYDVNEAINIKDTNKDFSIYDIVDEFNKDLPSETVSIGNGIRAGTYKGTCG
jgi:DNA repair exonuclease SbcCD nuclease subunit